MLLSGRQRSRDHLLFPATLKIDSHSLDLGIERGAADAQSLRCPRHVARVLGEGLLDHLTFDLVASGAERRVSGRR